MKHILIVLLLFVVSPSFIYGREYNEENKVLAGESKRIVLEGNEVRGKRVLTQSMFKDAIGNPLDNTVFVIKYDFILLDDIAIPSGCMVEFKGGSISGHGLKGTVQNKTLYAKWFKDDISLLYSINNLTGYSVIHLEKGKTYQFTDVISPKCAITLNGSSAKIERSGVTNVSKPIISINTKKSLDHFILENIDFDGGIASGLPVEINYHQNMVVITNVSNVCLRNVSFKNSRPPYISNVSPSNDFIDISQYNQVKLDNVVFKNNLLYGEVVNLFPAGGNATPTSNVSNDKVEIVNSVFDFRGGRCYSAVNCYGGILNFRHNEIYGCIGALNAHVHDSYIVDNIYADAQNGFVDLSEQGQFYSRNVTISGNTIKNITKFNHSQYGKNSTHLLECYGAEDIKVIKNTYEPSSTGTETDGTGHVFALSNGTKNVLIKKNRILCNGQLYGNVMGEPNKNIQFVDNYIFQGHKRIYGLIRLNKEKGISFVRNTFKVSNSENERITGALVFIDKEGQTIEGFQFSKNKLNCAVSIPMIVYIGKGDYPILHNFELIGNRARGNSKISVSIKNKSGKATSLRNNRGIDVEEANVL